MIVWLVSYPRSGNTYCRMLFKNFYGLDTYSIYDDPNFEKMGASSEIGHKNLPTGVDELRERDELYVIKNHKVPTTGDRVIFLVRDGRAAQVSRSHTRVHGKDPANKRFLKDLESLIRGKEWASMVHQFLEVPLSPCRKIITYEDLVKRPIENLVELENFLKVSVKDDGKLPDFKSLHKRWPGFFRVGKTDSWKDEMPTRLQDLFWELQGDAMSLLGYLK